MNKVITYEEELLLNPLKQLRKRFGEDGQQSPMEWSEALDNVAHLIAARDAATWAMQQELFVSEAGAIEAEAFAIDLMNKYWKIIENLGGVYTQNSVNYDQDLLALTSVMENTLEKRVEQYGEGFSALVTSIILNRVAILEAEGDQAAMNIKQLPPLPVLHDGVYKKYKQRQEEIQYYSETNAKGEKINKYDSEAIYNQEIRDRKDVSAMLTQLEGPCS